MHPYVIEAFTRGQNSFYLKKNLDNFIDAFKMFKTEMF